MTIYGIDQGGDLWVERDGDLICLTPQDLATMRGSVREKGEVARAGHTWDESQVDSLIRSLTGSPELGACTTCGERPVLHRVDDRCDACGDVHDHAAGEVAHIRAVAV